jgi:hypothetical protein
MRKFAFVATALAAVAVSTSAFAYKPGYPQHCQMVKSCHKYSDFPFANNASPDLPICKTQVCTMQKVCD